MKPEQSRRTETMHCIDCGSGLVGSTPGECSACGRAYDPLEPATFTRALARPLRLCDARTAADACLLRSRLEREGVHARIEHGSAGAVETGRASVWVNREDLERGREILRGYRRARDSHTDCPRCRDPMKEGYVWVTSSSLPGNLEWSDEMPGRRLVGKIEGEYTVCTAAARPASRCEHCGVVLIEPGVDFFRVRPDGPLECLACGEVIPVGVATCSACGWTYVETET